MGAMVAILVDIIEPQAVVLGFINSSLLKLT